MTPENQRVDHPIICFGDFRLDHQLRSLQRGEGRVRLAAKPLATLEFLIRNRHRVVAKTELLREVWGGQQEINTVEQAVRQVRKALEDDQSDPRYIETIPGQGYRFVAEVHAATSNATAESGSPRHPSHRRPPYGAAVGILILCLAGFAASRLLHRPENVARVIVNGGSLVAMSSAGHVLWTHELGKGFGFPAAGEAQWRTQIEDLDGDGVPEVLVAASSADPSRTEQLVCYSASGKALWHYQPQPDVEFGTTGMKGPWSFKDILVTSGKGNRSIWIAFAHSVWWPSFVVRLSPAGSPNLVFANPGTITSLRKIETDSGSYILATGVNNAYALAFVAMLAEGTPPALAPQTTDPRYRCAKGCPGRGPYRYILLPRSEVSAALLPYSLGQETLTRPGGLTVKTIEVPEGYLGPGGRPSGFFYFSNDFQPEGAAYADGYRQVHESLEMRGLIKHSFKDCPEQKSPAVLDVFDENGHWSQVAVPRIPASN